MRPGDFIACFGIGFFPTMAVLQTGVLGMSLALGRPAWMSMAAWVIAVICVAGGVACAIHISRREAEAMASEAQKRAKAKYEQKCRKVRFTLYPTDADIAAKIDSVDNIQAYVKSLIRKDIEQSGK